MFMKGKIHKNLGEGTLVKEDFSGRKLCPRLVREKNRGWRGF